ncbi:hypothetical protein [Alicyclobacillus fodiniaquatilis]|uniref:Uncharacterized protein n=1 Tax=Alicyclobacillus fodiniaquatilis TaxID=1661150 RepID=A0ABW4JDX8_9BACL
MVHSDAILTEELCDAIISEAYDSKEYQTASSYLESEIMKMLGEDEAQWSKHNDAYTMLENSVVRKAFEIGYALGKADKQSIEVVSAAL